MKKLTLIGGMAALAMFAMNASAVIPKHLESVNFTATLTVADGEVTKTISANNKDLLSLVALEFGQLPTGAQLASYGLESDGAYKDYFVVLYSNGNVYLDDASADGDDYALYFYPYEDEYTEKETATASDTWNYELDGTEFVYESGTDADSFTVYGLLTDTVSYDSYNENYKLSNATGTFDLPVIDTGDDEGIITVNLSGSGTDVDEPLFY
jgi:hypothetical protein